MSDDYEIGRLRDGLVLVYFDGEGKRHRHALRTDDPGEARKLAPALYAELTRPKGVAVKILWDAYTAAYKGRAVVETMQYTWKALSARFAAMDATAITVADCEAHTEERRSAGIKDYTIYTELGHLRMVLLWNVKQGNLEKAPHIARPPQPKRAEDIHLTREQVRALIDGAPFPHLRLAVVMLYTTAARVSALLGLTWDRCDFERERIDLRDPTITRPHKGRAIVPMLRTAKAALLEARQGALSPFVIEWGGERVGSIKKGVKSAQRTAGLTGRRVSPHILRHSAAVHMAEDDVSMEKIQQFLGHNNIETTRQIYARFSPNYLKDAAAALELDDLGSFKKREKR